jgi:teichuronic acid biosynthesis glycosyltransferase TuaC
MSVLIFTNMYPTPEKPVFGTFVRTQVECLRRAGVELELLALDGPVRKLIYPKGLVQLHQRLRRGGVDLVHAHYGYTGIVARMQYQVPLVVTFHGSDLYGSYGENGRSGRLNSVISASSKVLARVADAVIVQNRKMANMVPHAKAHIIPHEIDFDTFQVTPREEARKRLGLDLSKKYLLFAADPSNGRKNFPLARDAAEELKRTDQSVELLAVWQESQDRLALYMCACDALIFPSYAEGSPNVVKQAMACNLPIVASDAGDIREVIADTDGCFVCPLETTAFVEPLREILCERRRTRGRENVQRFAPQRVVQQLLNVYENVLGRQLPLQHGVSLVGDRV